jgi:hypothetical protein
MYSSSFEHSGSLADLACRRSCSSEVPEEIAQRLRFGRSVREALVPIAQLGAEGPDGLPVEKQLFRDRFQRSCFLASARATLSY